MSDIYDDLTNLCGQEVSVDLEMTSTDDPGDKFILNFTGTLEHDADRDSFFALCDNADVDIPVWAVEGIYFHPGSAPRIRLGNFKAHA